MSRKRVASRLHLLSVHEVQTANSGDHSDGGGLVLRIGESSAAWVLRFTSPSGRRREMGLGAADRNNAVVAGKSLTAAREAAHSARALLLQGVDPIDERDARRAALRDAEAAKKAGAKRDALTLARAARAYHERVVEPIRTDKHSAQWIASLENNVPPAIWHKPIADVSVPELLDAIAELHARFPETASLVWHRLEAIFDDVEFRGQCSGNPARAIRRKLREVKGRRERGSLAALDYRKAPAFVRQLRAREAIAARALEFAVLTASRTCKVIGAVWSEFDLEAGVWTIPGSRMKGGEQHVVHLSPRALEIVAAMRDLKQPNVFPSPSLSGRPLSNMAMLTLLRRMDADGETTVHGLCRSTFSTWANETGAARPDVIEACLAHNERNLVRAAYNRAQFAAERKALLLAWAEYLDGRAPACNVIELTTLRAA